MPKQTKEKRDLKEEAKATIKEVVKSKPRKHEPSTVVAQPNDCAFTDAEQAVFADFDKHRKRNLWRAVMMTRRLFATWAENLYDEHGYQNFKPHHMAVLSKLELEGTAMSDLAEKIHCTKQAVSKMVKEMEHAGYVRTQQHASDRRSSLVLLTAKGFEILKFAMEQFGEAHILDFTGLNHDEMNQLTDLLQKVVDHRLRLAPAFGALV